MAESEVVVEEDSYIDNEDAVEKVYKYMQEKVKLDNGEDGYVFSSVGSEPGKGRLKCNVCDVQLNSQVGNIEEHATGKAHTKNIKGEFFPHEKFPKLMIKEISKLATDVGGTVVSVPGADVPTLAPGEPVPPGLEDVVTRVPEIMPTLDEMQAPLIGLEFLAEITPILDEVEPKYWCLLCNKRGDPRTVLAHLVCFNHRIKYICRYFPKTNMALALVPKVREFKRGAAEVLALIVKAIEAKFGRLQPMIVDGKQFDTTKEEVYKVMASGRHFHESSEASYEKLVDIEFIKSCAPDTETLTIDLEKDEAKKRSATMKSQMNFHYKHRQIIIQNKKNIACLKTTTRKRERSKSVETVSTESSSRSPSLSERRSRSRSRSRSHSRSRGLRYIYRDYKRDRSNRRSRSRSPRFRRRSRERKRSRSGSRGRMRELQPYVHKKPWQSSYSRTRSDRSDRSDRGKGIVYRRRERSREPEYLRDMDRPKSTQMKIADLRSKRVKRDSYRDKVGELEKEMTKTLKTYEKNPEKHPLYPEEWKKFWNRRYKELTAEGVDASKHDFKPEWIKFWTSRMKELHEEDLKEKKEAIRIKLGLRDTIDMLDDDVVEVSPTPLEDEKPRVTVADIKNTWKALTGSDIRGDTEEKTCFKVDEIDNVRPDPTQPVRVITVLRLLAALESQLGSLGPRINNLLSQAIAMEKRKDTSSDVLLEVSENSVLFETVKEKLKGQLFAGIVERKMVNATRVAIQHVAEMFNSWTESKQKAEAVVNASILALPPPQPLIVPGIGAVDKVAIAQQIASALVAQGKTNVTQDELEQLINAVVGMAQASTGQQQPITAAAYAAQLQSETAVAAAICAPQPVPPPMNKPPVEATISMDAVVNRLAPTQKATAISSLKLIQSYDDVAPKGIAKGMTTEEMADLTEEDMKTLLQNFKDLSPEEQQCLITYLKDLEAKEPESVEKLRKFVNLGADKPAETVVQPEVREKRDDSGRLSPFSMREGGANPMTDEKAKGKEDIMDEDDDDYSYEDIFRAAEKKVSIQAGIDKENKEKMEQEKETAIRPQTPRSETASVAEEEGPSRSAATGLGTDAESVLSEAKMMIADIMGQLPTKFNTGGARPAASGAKTTPTFSDTNTPTPPRQASYPEQGMRTEGASGPSPATHQGENNSSNLLNDYNYQDDIFSGHDNPNISASNPSMPNNNPNYANSYAQNQNTNPPSDYNYNSNRNPNFNNYDSWNNTNNSSNSNNYQHYPTDGFEGSHGYNGPHGPHGSQQSYGNQGDNFNPYSNRSQQFNNGPPQHFNNGPPQHFNNGPPQHFNRSDMYNGQPNYNPQHFNNNPRFHSNNFQRYY